jgi:hypothetical protein
MRAGRFNRLAGAGKENATGRLTVSQKCSGKGIAAVAMIKDQKATKQSVRHRGGAGLVASQVVEVLIFNNLLIFCSDC